MLLAAAATPLAAVAQDSRPVFGAGRGDQDQAREGVRSGRQIPLSRVLDMFGPATPAGI